MFTPQTRHSQALARLTGRTTRHCTEWMRLHGKRSDDRYDALEYFAKYGTPEIWTLIRGHYAKK